MENLQVDELAALIAYHSGRRTQSGTLVPEAASRLAQLLAALQGKHAVMAQGRPQAITGEVR